jgi:deoxynogalonate / 12-deoxyaklanonic acid monooxygenase
LIAFINTFTVTGDDKEFRRLIAAHERFLRTQPGFGGFELRPSDVRPGEYINIIQWEDAASHRRLIETREFREQITSILVVASVACSPVMAKADNHTRDTEFS